MGEVGPRTEGGQHSNSKPGTVTEQIISCHWHKLVNSSGMASSAKAAAQAAANAEKLKRYVRVGFEGAEASYKQVPRYRMTVVNINRLFSCDVEFLCSSDNAEIVMPKDWPVECLPPPTVYFIKEKAWAMLESDPMEEDEYRGQTLVVIDNVPAAVSEAGLMAWLNCGLDDDDPDLSAARSQLEWLEDRLRNVERQIRELPNAKLSSGAFGAKEDLELKKIRAGVLAMQKTELNEDIRELSGKFDRLRLFRESLADPVFALRLVETRMPLNLAVWEARFGNDRRGARQAYIACHKKDWAAIFLAVHSKTGAPMTGKNEISQMTELHVRMNMRSVTVSRRRHGVGMYMFPDERGYYSGQWRRGLRHGTGTAIDQVGRYQGEFAADNKCGVGSQVFAHGDTLRGQFGGGRYHAMESLLGGDEYKDGVPHGRCSVGFADGSTFDGEWWNGVPCGAGRYVGAAGGVVEGDFGPWTALHGFGSTTRGETTQMGLWHHGQLSGSGVELDTVLGNYEGEWRQGEKAGWGVLNSTAMAGRYAGWWKAGLRWGAGSLDYGSLAKESAAAEDRAALLARARTLATRAAAEGRLASAVEALAKARSGSGGEGGSALGPGAGLEGDGAAPRAAKGKTSYELAQEDSAGKLKYRGDFNFHCRWLASLPRDGGVFTARNGRAEPNFHTSKPTLAGRHKQAPGGFADWDTLEAVLARRRSAIARASVADAYGRRLLKEGINLREYGLVMKTAEALLPEVRARNRETKGDVADIRAGLKKVGVKFDDKGEEDEPPMADADIMDMLSNEEVAEINKVVPPSEVREGYMI